MRPAIRLLWLLVVLVQPLCLPAQAAGDLRILALTNTLAPELVAKFERETGTSVKVEELPGSLEMVDRLMRGGTLVDIAIVPDHQVAGLIERGRLERVWADRLPGFWNIEDPWRSRSFDPRNEYTIPHQWGTTAFAVDTSVHKGDIDTLRLLFDPPPEVADRIGLLDEADMIQLAMIYLGEGRCASDPARMEKARKELRRLLARSQPTRPPSLVTGLSTGSLALAVIRSGDAMRARDNRPSLAFAYPREGNLVWTDVIAVPRDPANRGNALKFLTFMLRPENAALQSNHNRFANMIRGSETYMLPPVLSAPELVAPWPAKVGFLVSCGAKVQRQHEEAWRQLKLQAVRTEQP